MTAPSTRPINLSLISPSSVGKYMACSMRLVYDSMCGRPFSSNKWADFGTVCHWETQTLMGCGPLEKPSAEIYANAAKGFDSMAAMIEQSKINAKVACSLVPKAPAGRRWLAEVPTNDKTLLSERVNRKGEKKGFGGSIDLLLDDNSILIDFKFKGKPPEYLSHEYLWQMLSYHILRKARRTIIIYVGRYGEWKRIADLSWDNPLMAEFAANGRAAIEHMGHANYALHAYPNRGPHCDEGYCDHKTRCGPYALPPPFDTYTMMFGAISGGASIDERKNKLREYLKAKPVAAAAPEATTIEAMAKGLTDATDAADVAALFGGAAPAPSPEPPPAPAKPAAGADLFASFCSLPATTTMKPPEPAKPAEPAKPKSYDPAMLDLF